jgi:hypothetical protein
MMRVLVDDDPQIVRTLQINLRFRGYGAGALPAVLPPGRAAQELT